MWWEMACAKVPYPLECKMKTTSCQNNGHETSGFWKPWAQTYYIEYMDRHNLDCGEKGFMRGFKFVNCRDSKSKGTGGRKYTGLQFTYDCCYPKKN